MLSLLIQYSYFAVLGNTVFLANLRNLRSTQPPSYVRHTSAGITKRSGSWTGCWTGIAYRRWDSSSTGTYCHTWRLTNRTGYDPSLRGQSRHSLGVCVCKSRRRNGKSLGLIPRRFTWYSLCFFRYYSRWWCHLDHLNYQNYFIPVCGWSHCWKPLIAGKVICIINFLYHIFTPAYRFSFCNLQWPLLRWVTRITYLIHYETRSHLITGIIGFSYSFHNTTRLRGSIIYSLSSDSRY